MGAACDPNVVIGAKWGVSEEPAAGSNVGGSSAGTGASPNTAGSETGGGSGTPSTGGTSSNEAGAPGAAGADSTVYFEADHEGSDDLAIWDTGPDMDSGGYYADADPPRFSADGPAHSGSGSVEVTIDTSTGTAPIARLYRRIEHDRAYYSSWFYLLEEHEPSTWWSIFLFRARRDRSDSIDLWSVDLEPVDGEDRLSLAIYDHQRGENLDLLALPTVPIAQWFQLEAYLEFAEGEPSQLELWLNEELVLSRSDLNEMPEGEPIYWVIGNGGSTLTPPVSTIYLDDAIISPTRVGPN
jgi:hypothetical protein